MHKHMELGPYAEHLPAHASTQCPKRRVAILGWDNTHTHLLRVKVCSHLCVCKCAFINTSSLDSFVPVWHHYFGILPGHPNATPVKTTKELVGGIQGPL